MSDPALIALLSGAGSTLLVQLIGWLRGHRKDNAVADRTVGEAWQAIVEELRQDVRDLRNRVTALEDELGRERDRVKALTAEVDRYKAIAKSLAKHVLRLRDELAKKNDADVPPLPSDVEDAMTVIDLP
jgi:chromosome segregation ATPase